MNLTEAKDITRAPQLEETPETPPSSPAEGLLSCMAWRATPGPLSKRKRQTQIFLTSMFFQCPQWDVDRRIRLVQKYPCIESPLSLFFAPQKHPGPVSFHLEADELLAT